MVFLTRINQKPIVLNSDLIEHVEVTPDTVICMTTGQKYVVLEPAAEVVKKVLEYRRTISALLSRPPWIEAAAQEPAEMEGAGEQ